MNSNQPAVDVASAGTSASAGAGGQRGDGQASAGQVDAGQVDAGQVDAEPLDAGATSATPRSYSPCPNNGEVCEILPLGDSITFGLYDWIGAGLDASDGGYRVELFRKASADAKNITFVGSLSNGPQQVDGNDFPRAHEGHNSWAISQVASLIPSPALDQKPQIILLMAGTNDLWQGPDGAPERLDALIGNIVTALPNSVLVVAQIMPSSLGDPQAFNTSVKRLVQARVDKGEHVVIVDMYTPFAKDESLTTDGIHPNKQGYVVMAQVWYDAIKDILR